MRCFLSMILLSATAAIGIAEYPRPELLVEVADKTDDFVILDARGREKYDAGHLPGAIWVDHAAWSKAFGANPDPNAWSERLGALGLKPRSKTLVYDDALQKDAARIWWILRYFGVQDVRLLNGGWPAWVAADRPTSKESPTVTATRFPIAVDSARFADKISVLDVIKSKTMQIIDARSEKEHCGDSKLAKQGGHIPGAMHLEWSDALNKTTQKFKSAVDLKQLFQKAGIDPLRPALTHCQSGGRAAVMAFTLELMGAAPVANYYRGWSEWGNSDDTPIRTLPKEK